MKISTSRIILAVCLVAGLAVSGCSRSGSSVGSRISPFSGKSSKQLAGIGVNSFLWRASLETIDFMPLESADPYGGVIITGWHSDTAAPTERFKATVYILDTRLRADGLKVSVFKQTQNESGYWVAANVDPDTEIQIENSILTRARELKISTLN